jgi:hypothetical protein
MAPAAGAQPVMPKSAGAFQNSVGVNTHIVYFDTAYGDWSRIVSALDELGVKHLRDGVYANPSPQWHDWNEAYYARVELAARHGLKFDLGFSGPGPRGAAGTSKQLLAVIRDRLRGAVDALEAPNEFDRYGLMAQWWGPLAAYDRQMYKQAKADRSLRSLPVVGPVLAGFGANAMLGDQQRWLDVGNIHPYTGGEVPAQPHDDSELRKAGQLSARKPVWATEAGFNYALREPSSTGAQPPISESAGAIYTLETLLEHFKDGIGRTYLYELIDEFPDPKNANPEEHFGLLRNNFSPKPAFTALKNLLELVGHGAPRGGLRPLRLDVTGDADQLRQLVLQKADGSYVVALWRTTSIWNTHARRGQFGAAHSITIRLPAGTSARIADPIASASTTPLRLRDSTGHIAVGRHPVVMLVNPQ